MVRCLDTPLLKVFRSKAGENRHRKVCLDEPLFPPYMYHFPSPVALSFPLILHCAIPSPVVPISVGRRHSQAFPSVLKDAVVYMHLVAQVCAGTVVVHLCGGQEGTRGC